MGLVVDILVRELVELSRAAGRGGGLVGPSVYDTAVAMRLAPPREGPEPALEWLLSQQRSDGGWCSPRYPAGRDLSTLAAILALHPRQADRRTRDACAAGVAFLRRQAPQWQAVPDDAPIAVELLLPSLARLARGAGVDVGEEPYRELAAVGREKRAVVDRLPLVRGAPATYAWEALGLAPSAGVLDAAGSVGTSPAATAAWLSAARGSPALAGACERATAYLARAAAATGCGVPGVLPVVFPVERFEQSWTMMAVTCADLWQYSAIAEALAGPVSELARAARPGGFGYSDVFTENADDTACAIAALHAAGREVSPAPLRRFEDERGFFVFPGERNPSISANAHAHVALARLGEGSAPALRFLKGRMGPDGRFVGDKFHASWLYATHRAALALSRPADVDALARIRAALLAHQRPDGGFGAAAESTAVETAHGLMTLRALRDAGLRGPDVDAAVGRALAFLLARHTPFGPPEEPLWIGKELYAMPRVDRAFELCAMLSVALEQGR